MIVRLTFQSDPPKKINVRLLDEFDEARVRDELRPIIAKRWPALRRVRFKLKLDYGD